MLRELLSPTHLESTTGGSEELAKGLGVSSEQIDKALSVLSPEKVQQLSDELGHELFGQLLTKDGKIIHDFSQAIDLAGDDAVARNAIEKVLQSNVREKISDGQLEQILTDLVQFTQKYPGRVSGDFASHFYDAVSERLEVKIGGQAEIETAKDLLDGRTPLDSSDGLEGIPQSEESGVKTPDYRVTGADGVPHLVEVKAVKNSITKNSLGDALSDAISQIKAQALETGERGNYIRIDARYADNPPKLTPQEIYRRVNGQLLDKEQRGIDYVEYVEILYKDASGQAQRLLYGVQNNRVVQLFP